MTSKYKIKVQESGDKSNLQGLALQKFQSNPCTSFVQEEIVSMAPYFEDIRQFLSNSSDFLGAMHMNLQADNAYLWKDEEGDLDAGIFDWCLELKGFCYI